MTMMDVFVLAFLLWIAHGAFFLALGTLILPPLWALVGVAYLAKSSRDRRNRDIVARYGNRVWPDPEPEFDFDYPEPENKSKGLWVVAGERP